MSRIGKSPVSLPKGVKAAVVNGVLTVEGPLGKLERTLHSAVSVAVDPAAGGPETAGIKELSQWYTSILEQVIRREPAQYWWVHRRWRGKPGKAKVKRSSPDRHAAA
jgi:hypothetical protein